MKAASQALPKIQTEALNISLWHDKIAQLIGQLKSKRSVVIQCEQVDSYYESRRGFNAGRNVLRKKASFEETVRLHNALETLVITEAEISKAVSRHKLQTLKQ